MKRPLLFSTLAVAVASLIAWGADELPAAPKASFELSPKQETYYVGQRVNATVSLNLGDSDLYSSISLDGMPDGNAVQAGEFRKLDSGSPQKIVFTTGMILLKTGTIVFSPVLSGQISVRVKSVGFIRRNIYPFRSQANPMEIKIKVPPLDGRPENYCGAVGEFRLTAELTPRNCSAGDLLNLKWSLMGNGLVDDITGIEYNPGKDFKVYPPRMTSQADGVVSFSQVIIPMSTNVTEAAAFRLSVFNPVKGEYENLSSGHFRLTVTERVVQSIFTNALSELTYSKSTEESEKAPVQAEAVQDGFLLFLGRRRGETTSVSMATTARLCPDSVSKILFDIPSGASVEVREHHGDWCRVLYEGAAGWMPGAILGLSSPEP